MRLNSLLFLLLIAVMGCKSQDKGKQAVASTTQEHPGLELLMSDNYGGSENFDFQVIRDVKTMRLFFTGVNKTRKPGIPVPDIDFSKQMVLVYCPGKSTEAGPTDLYMKEDLPDQVILGLKSGNLKQKTGNEALIMPFNLYTLPFTDKKIVLQKQ